jgi:hypothetical protein
VLGSWVWDCDHWKPGGEHTEFHPVRAIWVRRAPGRASLRSSFGEAEADLVISTDKTPAGAQADCALPRVRPRSFRACLEADTGWQDVTGSYSFVLRAPPRPEGAERLVARARDRGSTPGGPPLRLELGTDSVTVSVDVKSAPGQRIVIAKQIFLGWRPAPRPIHLRVTLDRLLVRRAMDPPLPRESTRRDQTTLSPGDWNVYWEVGGTWGTWSPRLLHPRDGRSFAFGRAVDLYVGPHTPWRVAVYARECDVGGFGSARGRVALTPCPLDRHEFASGNDNPGVARQSFVGMRRAVGRHRVDAGLPDSSCPRSNKHGCYQLAYQVRVIPRRRR